MSSKTSETIISEDIDFKGKLRFSDTIRINGKFRGTIESTGKLIVGSTGHVEADINVGEMVIEGNVQGNIDASNTVKINKNGVLSGDIRTPDLEIQSGAKFIGNCSMNV